MGDIILFLISIFFVVIMGLLTYRAIKKSNSLAEKIIELILAMVMGILLVIYYLDRCNIPTKLNWGININTQNWLSFIGNYITGIISAVIGALVAVWTTLYQIEKNNEDNDEREAKNLRIQNMPILKYSLNTNEDVPVKIDNLIETRFNEGNVYNLNIKIKNIGLNNIKNIKIDLESNVNKNTKERIIGKETLEVLEKGEEMILRKLLTLKSNNIPYEIILTVYYQDVLLIGIDKK